MTSINTRIGSQNVIRVLSNASAAPTRLINLNDIESTLKTRDGMILVWDLATETFFMTDTIDSSSLNITGIATFSNTTNSSAPTNGALVINGGLGIAKRVNIGEGITVAGVSTFASNLDINAAVDILNGLTVNSTFNSVGVTTLASAGGITTTGGHLYVGTNLEVAGTSNFIGNATFRGGTIGIGDSTSDDIDVGGEFISNLVPNADNTFDIGITTQRWRDGKFSNVLTTDRLESSGQSQLNNLNVSGVSTFAGAIDFNGSIDIDGHVEVDNLNVSGVSTFAGAIDANGNLDVDGHTELDNVNISGVSTFTNDVNVTGDLRVTGFASVTQGLYYDSNDYDGPNGIAYFDNTGKLIGAASTENALTESHFVLTTNNVGIPTWTSVIDGGSY